MLSQATSLVTNGDFINSPALPLILCALLVMMSKANKLPLKMEAVAHDNNKILMLKPDYQTSVTPHSTDNCGEN